MSDSIQSQIKSAMLDINDIATFGHTNDDNACCGFILGVLTNQNLLKFKVLAI